MTTVFPTSVPATSAFVCPTFTLSGPPRTKKNHGVAGIPARRHSFVRSNLSMKIIRMNSDFPDFDFNQ